jgi:hypothetical protein
VRRNRAVPQEALEMRRGHALEVFLRDLDVLVEGLELAMEPLVLASFVVSAHA